MGKIYVDRMSVIWQGDEDIKTASEFRKAVGYKGMNKIFKQLVREYLLKNK